MGKPHVTLAESAEEVERSPPANLRSPLPQPPPTEDERRRWERTEPTPANLCPQNYGASQGTF